MDRTVRHRLFRRVRVIDVHGPNYVLRRIAVLLLARRA